MRVTLVTPPAVEPLTATEVKARLGYGTEVSDSLAASLITASRQQLDGWGGWLGRALNTQTWLMTLPGFFQDGRTRYWFDNRTSAAVNNSKIRIPIPPLVSISFVKYVDLNGTLQTLSSGAYQILSGTFSELVPVYGTDWPQTRDQEDAVQIQFVSGYGSNGSDVPEPIRCAISLQVAHLRSLTAQNLFTSLDRVEGVGEKRYIVGTGAGDVISAAVKSLIANYRIPV